MKVLSPSGIDEIFASLKNSYVEALTPSVIGFGDEFFEK